MRHRTMAWLGIGLLLAGVALGNPTAVARASSDTQTRRAGQVTIKATWQGPGVAPTFSVVLDTHAVNLDGYDLLQLAVLRTDQGAEASPIGWDAPPGGHHREGTLSFPATTIDGGPLVPDGTRVLELVIREVGGVPESVLRWELP
jgi:hypothetical protein